MRRRLLMVGRMRYGLPLDGPLRSKFDAVEDAFELRVVARGDVSDATFRLLSGGLRFWIRLPLAIAAEARALRPHAIVAQDPHVAAAALAAVRGAPVIVEVHGDWRTATRLYGSRARRLLNPLADAVASRAVRRAAAVRTVSPYTTSLVRELGREPDAEFPAFMDLDAFLVSPRPLPHAPRLLFVGVLEHYKGIDELAAAWRLVAARLPDTTLHVVGRGSRAHTVAALVRDLPDRTSWAEHLSPAGIVSALDEATALVLPSRSEGMGRVVVEALCRGRPVVATRVGGIVDLVHDGENGLLVPPREPGALANALERLLVDGALAEMLAANARASIERWLPGAEGFAERLRLLVEGVAT